MVMADEVVNVALFYFDQLTRPFQHLLNLTAGMFYFRAYLSCYSLPTFPCHAVFLIYGHSMLIQVSMKNALILKDY